MGMTNTPNPFRAPMDTNRAKNPAAKMNQP